MVIITITPEKIRTQVLSGKKSLSDRSETMISSGEARGDQKGDVFDDLPDHESIAESIEFAGLDIFFIASELHTAKHERF